MSKIVSRDALIVVDVQEDFIHGSLAVPNAWKVLNVVDEVARLFYTAGAQMFYTMDYHPEDHCSFQERGGPWPAHCVRRTMGARILTHIYPESTIIRKGAERDRDAYSGFDGTILRPTLNMNTVDRVFICGLATDFCVKATALDAVKFGFNTYLLRDACAAVKDGHEAMAEMFNKGVGASQVAGLV
jgi:nicotinamidase/pyrazinamidase